MASETVPAGTPPRTLPDLIPWFEQFSRGLVRLAHPSIAEIQTAIDALDSALRVGAPPPMTSGTPAPDAGPWREALEQLHWLLGIVERDDHGGNRQALGQYGLLVAESLRAHLDPTLTPVESAARVPPTQPMADRPRRSPCGGAGGKLMRTPGPGAPP